MTTNNFIDAKLFLQRRAAAKWFESHSMKKSRYDLFESFIEAKSRKLHCYLLLIIHNSNDTSNQIRKPSDRLVFSDFTARDMQCRSSTLFAIVDEKYAQISF